MKVVYNTKGFGVQLNEAEMKMFCAVRGYTLRPCHDEPVSSSTTFFTKVHWEDFRADPLLVELCEAHALSNQDLVVGDFNADYWFDTDFRTYEKVLQGESK